MGILAWIILGLIAGAIAKAIYPGKQGGGIVATTLLGIVGALVGGFVGNALFGTGEVRDGLAMGGIISAILGAVVVLFIWGMVTKNKTLTSH